MPWELFQEGDQRRTTFSAADVRIDWSEVACGHSGRLPAAEHSSDDREELEPFAIGAVVVDERRTVDVSDVCADILWTSNAAEAEGDRAKAPAQKLASWETELEYVVVRGVEDMDVVAPLRTDRASTL